MKGITRYLAILIVGAVFGQGSGEAAAPVAVKRIEYYQRWTQSQFPQSKPGSDLSAELPPEYQRAFSLVILPDAAHQTLDVDYHAMMLMRPASHQHLHRKLGRGDYLKLTGLLNQKLACESAVESGWAGPAPVLIRIERAGSSLELYTGGAQGPAGPDEASYRRNQRYYLCQDALPRYLEQVMRQLQAR